VTSTAPVTSPSLGLASTLSRYPREKPMRLVKRFGGAVTPRRANRLLSLPPNHPVIGMSARIAADECVGVWQWTRNGSEGHPRLHGC
jgi:hypothetical protein